VFGDETFVEDEGVLVLDKDNFDKAVDKFSHLLVEFFAPWCGHCKSLAPEYSKAAQTLKNSSSTIRLAKVDATEQTDLAEKFTVRGYPTFKFFHFGTPINYRGGRNAEEIVQWLNKKLEPPAKNIDGLQAFKEEIDKQDVTVLGFFKDQKSDAAKAFLDVALETDESVFLITSAAHIFTEYNIDKDSVVLIKKFDDGRVDLTDNLTAQAMKDFILKNRMPHVVEFSDETAQWIFGEDHQRHLLLFVSKKSKDFQTHYDVFKTVAPLFKGKVLFVYVNIDRGDHIKILEFFGMKMEDCPTFRYIKLGTDQNKYKPDGTDTLTVGGVKDFLQDVLDGKRKPHLKSEEIPEDWDSKPLKVLVGKNYEEVVTDPKKHVLVEFYAPWCGFCKELAPVYEELAEKYKDNEDYIIAKIDAIANEVEDIRVPSFPTIKYYPKDNGQVIDFDGDRTLDGFVRFLESGGKDNRRSDLEPLKPEGSEGTDEKKTETQDTASASGEKKKDEL